MKMETDKTNTSFFHGKTVDGNRFTICGMVDGNTVRLGISVCSKKDNFIKSKGRKIAFGRVLNQRVGKNNGTLTKKTNSLDNRRVIFLGEVINYNNYNKRMLLDEFNLKGDGK